MLFSVLRYCGRISFQDRENQEVLNMECRVPVQQFEQSSGPLECKAEPLTILHRCRLSEYVIQIGIEAITHIGPHQDECRTA